MKWKLGEMASGSSHDRKALQTEAQREYFDRTADAYHRSYHVTPVQRMWDMEFFHFLSRHGFKSPRVLEIGCGTGNLARLFSPDQVAQYIGTDLSKEMLKFAQLECPWATFLACDIFHLPFPDESFDIVIVAGTLHHLHDDTLTAALREISRVLVSHGHLYGREPVADGPFQLASVSPSLSFALMSIMHWVYVRTRTLVDKEPPMDSYHTSYDPRRLYAFLQNGAIRVEEFQLKFPVSNFVQAAGIGSKVARADDLDRLARAVGKADREIERLRRYGNETFYRGVKHLYDLSDTTTGLQSFLNEDNPPTTRVALPVLKLALTIASIFSRLPRVR
jgi:ubiquinone/menaquinone biosynthesis C-methylase UbiE